jgi:hypothetical protein
MEKVDENIEQIENKHEKPVNDKICIIHHVDSQFVEGNFKYTSIHEILCETYNNLFKLNAEFTKSLSFHYCNVLIENLPKIVYGVNSVSREYIHIFLKKLLNIDKNFNEVQNNEIKDEAQVLERLIFTDLQLFISLYNHYLNINKIGYFRRILKFLYQPWTSIKAYFKDRIVINEAKKVFNVNDMDEVKYKIKF